MDARAGQTLLHYRLIEKIGEGGMGVVWKAQDTTLGRDVAIKFLPAAVTDDPQRLARFEREARVLAALNHPNVAGIYGAHEHDGVRFLAMELVGGEDLAARLARGPLPVDEALDVARQVAEALEVAHDHGIVHRDLKPANVRLTDDGQAKVLDFGLARADAARHATSGSEAHADPAHSPTVTSDATRTGTILGTAAYMSPEQARGKSVDRRTDIWALGCVLYECLTGRRPFEGTSTPDVLASIVSESPDLDALPDGTPPYVAALLRRCLEKDPRLRLRDAGELRVAIETAGAGHGHADPHADPHAAPHAERREAQRRSTLVAWTLVALLGIALAVVTASLVRPDRGGDGDRRTGSATASRWSIALPPATRVGLPSPGGGFDYSKAVAISRDGRKIAFCVRYDEDRTELYLKAEAATPAPVRGVTNARGLVFSPDGEWLAYYDTDDNGFYKVALAGGSPQKLGEPGRTVGFDATWSPDGTTLVFSTDDGLWRMPAGGGPVESLTVPDASRGETGHHFPRFTRDGRHVLFTLARTPDVELAVLDLASGTHETILADASSGVPVGADRIVVARAGELLVAPYDPKTHRVTGSLVPVEQGLHTSPGLGGVVLTQFDVSDTGTLAYVPGAARIPNDRLVWVDRDGGETLVTEGPGTWVHPRLSPDESRISVDIHARDGMRDLHVYEPDSGRMRRLTRTGMSWESEWRPDGERIALVSSAPAGQWSLFWVRTDFSGPQELLHHASHAIPGSWTSDGATLLFSDLVEGGIYRIDPDGDRTSTKILPTGTQEGFPRLSPDDRWMAYVQSESGRREVFVQSFPTLGPKYQVSVAGGSEPVWSRDGRRLFYRDGGRMLEVDVREEGGAGGAGGAHATTLRFGPPRVLFTGEYDSALGHQHYDVSRDGRRFLMIRHGVPEGPHEVRVVLDWDRELR